MEDAILKFLSGLNPLVSVILMGLGALLSLAVLIIGLTPTKMDDDELVKIEGIPIVGGLLKALLAMSPLKPKDPQ